LVAPQYSNTHKDLYNILIYLFIYLLQLGFHLVAVVSRLVQK